MAQQSESEKSAKILPAPPMIATFELETTSDKPGKLP